MHGFNLTPHERSVLRRLEDQLRKEDADLVDRLRRMPRLAGPMRFEPWYWSPTTYLVIGSVLLLLGLVLTVASSMTGGVALIALAVWRLRDKGSGTTPWPGRRRRGTGRLP